MKLINVNHYKVSYAGRRKTNEDSVLIEIDKKNGNRQVVMAVADGMGGYQKGEIASKMMINQLQRLSQEILPLDPEATANIVREHVKEANRSIFAETDKIKVIQMGTTVSGAVAINGQCLFFNVGDSRTYLINSEEIKQVTQDHSADGDKLRNGVIKESKVGKGHYSYALTRSIGTDAEVDVDIFPFQGFHQLKEGEMILCCTDGLWKSLTKQEISKEIFGRRNLGQALEALASLAYSKGSDDNISIAALEYGNFKMKKEKLRHFVPLSKFERKNQGKRSKFMFLLLAFFIIVFLAIVVLVAIKLHNPNSSPVRDNQNQKKPSISNNINLRNHPLTNKVDNNIPEDQEGKITFKPSGNTYRGGAQVQLIYENLRSPRGVIPSDIYYTIDGSEPTKENGKKYMPGEKIIFDKPGRYVIKAKLFSKMGKYEGNIHPQTYTIERLEPKVNTVETVEQLDEDIRDNIFKNTKKLFVDVNGVENVSNTNDIEMIVFVSKSGQAKMLKISNIDVIPKEKYEEIKDSLAKKIQAITFKPPTVKGKAVNAELKILFKKIAKYERKILLKR